MVLHRVRARHRAAVTRAVLSLGSNLGDRFAHLRAAVAGFADVLVAASPVYETAPWGGVEQPDFLNAVLVVADPGTDAWGWLRRGQRLEAAAGRVREVRWGPRTLDVDVVIACDGVHQRPSRAAAAAPGHRRSGPPCCGPGWTSSRTRCCPADGPVARPARRAGPGRDDGPAPPRRPGAWPP